VSVRGSACASVGDAALSRGADLAERLGCPQPHVGAAIAERRREVGHGWCRERPRVARLERRLAADVRVSVGQRRASL
jgi:hypothetical protein